MPKYVVAVRHVISIVMSTRRYSLLGYTATVRIAAHFTDSNYQYYWAYNLCDGRKYRL